MLDCKYPKRLIEVDLPIKRISAHARREKSIRHGHISTLHIWWARRPLASCRAVICASLWPDPADPLCPQEFRESAAKAANAFIQSVLSIKSLYEIVSGESLKRYQQVANGELPSDPNTDEGRLNLRTLLLDFIADFAAWEASTEPHFLETAKELTRAAHEALGGQKETRPLVVDPFAGGGAIPLEALRVGADAFASDLNPVAVLLNKVVLEYIPKYGQKLADGVRKWGNWVTQEAEKQLANYYPKDGDGAIPIAYLWARTIKCEGPGCGAEVPLIRSGWLARKGRHSVALRLLPNVKEKKVEFLIAVNPKAADVGSGTVARGAATCPCCGFTTPVESVRRQLKARQGGANDARMLCVVTTRQGEQGRSYRLPGRLDLATFDNAEDELKRHTSMHEGQLSLVPDELISLNELRRISVPLYGIEKWGNVFSSRQLLSLSVLAKAVRNLKSDLPAECDDEFRIALQTCLSLAVDRQADATSSLSRWHVTGEKMTGMFGRQALGMVWDFAEVNPFSNSSGSFPGAVEWVAKVCEANSLSSQGSGQSNLADAACHVLPDDAADALVTDPPYYDAVPYAHLSDLFYVWLRRIVGDVYPSLFVGSLVEKGAEIVVDRPHSLSQSSKDVRFYEAGLQRAFSEGRRVVRPTGVAVVIFASKTTASWEAVLQAIIDAGWIIGGSWPVDTEMAARVAAQGQARLASSVHIFCRPRENTDGSARMDDIGDWRDVLTELPGKIHEWMPRLAKEGVVGADAIFSCLGPALEIFSRYSRVEKANGEQVTLKEYLEHVWAAVAKEALDMVFAGADASGFEEDSRLTAMWLWTLSTGSNGNGNDKAGEVEDEAEEDDEETTAKPSRMTGFILEFDAARKIAQGLGVHMEQLEPLVEIEGDKARLLSVSERTRYLFGKDQAQAPTQRKKRTKQMTFTDLEQGFAEVEGDWGEKDVPKVGQTVLDRVHQSMILFAAGRSDALKRFLVEEGTGKDQRFWRLAQAFSALYPKETNEKRWVDGVLARKKGLGF